MGLFSSPLVLNDGTADRTFTWRSQQPDKKSVVGDYIEDAASIASESLIVVKHDKSGSVPRHLLQRTAWVAPAAGDGTLKRITINLTVVADEAFTAAEVLKEFTLMRDAMGEANVVSGLLSSKL